MMRFSLVIGLVMLCLLPAQAATLTVHVVNMDKKGGILRLGVYTEDLWQFGDIKPPAYADVPAEMPETTIVLHDVKPGVYGVKVYQDANSNDKFDQGFLGMPLEHYGFSRDARPFFAQPSFDRCKFTVKDGDNEITIHLQ